MIELLSSFLSVSLFPPLFLTVSASLFPEKLFRVSLSLSLFLSLLFSSHFISSLPPLLFLSLLSPFSFITYLSHPFSFPPFSSFLFFSPLCLCLLSSTPHSPCSIMFMYFNLHADDITGFMNKQYLMSTINPPR